MLLLLLLLLLFSIVIPTLVEGLLDQNLVTNSSTARSNNVSELTATFRCVVDSYPLATIAWYYNNSTVNDTRISITTYSPTRGRLVSILVVSAVEIRDRGTFTCTAVSDYGSVSSTANLAVFGELHNTCTSISQHLIC